RTKRSDRGIGPVKLVKERKPAPVFDVRSAYRKANAIRSLCCPRNTGPIRSWYRDFHQPKNKGRDLFRLLISGRNYDCGRFSVSAAGEGVFSKLCPTCPSGG